jgi:two-component system, OmpR family, sensor histidine kinase KdpD
VQSGSERVAEIEHLRELAAQLGCSFVVLGGPDVAGAITQAAGDVDAEHIVIGEVTSEGTLARLRPSLVDRIIDGLPDSNIHAIALVGHMAERPPGGTGSGGQRPDPMTLLRKVSSDNRRRAMLRVYLGYARGCGTTTAMLDEARRRSGRGTDAVVGAYRVHGDPNQTLAGLDVLGGPSGAAKERALDLEVVLARNPQVVCIDDLEGLDGRGRPRLEAVPRLLSAGITVLATLHLLSMRSAALAVSGLLDRGMTGPLIDDELLRVIDELEVVDVPPDELLQRIAEHGILTPAQQAMAMQQQLRPSVLAALRETALRMCADQVDRQFIDDLPANDGTSPMEVRGRIVLCLPVQRGLEERIRTAARYAHEQDATFHSRFGPQARAFRCGEERSRRLRRTHAPAARRVRAA